MKNAALPKSSVVELAFQTSVYTLYQQVENITFQLTRLPLYAKTAILPKFPS
jgi:hypothetical protein